MLEVLREERPLGEIANEYDISPNQLRNWKVEFLKNAPRAFTESKDEKEYTSAQPDLEFENLVKNRLDYWELSDTLDTAPVLAAVKKAIQRYGKPGIINSDQGSQFTSDEYTNYLRNEGIKQSMDGKGRWIDNVVIERWFRT